MTDPMPPLDEYLLGPDRVIARVNELVTTALDLAVSVLLAVGAWFVSEPHVPAGVPWVASGVVLLVFSMLAQWRNRVRPPKDTEPDPDAPLPGPSDPGNVHIMGR